MVNTGLPCRWSLVQRPKKNSPFSVFRFHRVSNALPSSMPCSTIVKTIAGHGARAAPLLPPRHLLLLLWANT
eukprot:scaffold1237_cov29-Tisochrysis_lutea.AAC.5